MYFWIFVVGRLLAIMHKLHILSSCLLLRLDGRFRNAIILYQRISVWTVIHRAEEIELKGATKVLNGFIVLSSFDA